MKIQIVILVILLFLYFVYSHKQKNAKRNFITWGCLLLGFEAGLRHIAVGPDTSGYYEAFQNIKRTTWPEVLSGFISSASDFRDPAYAVIEKAFSTISPSWQLFLIAISAFYFLALWKLLNRYIRTIDGVLLAFILYLSLFNIFALSGIRQCITMGIAFYLIPLINEKKWSIVVPTIIAGSTIHISLLFMLFFIPLMMIPDKPKRIIYFFVIILIPFIAIRSREIIAFITSFMANDYYAGYVDAEQEGNPIAFVAICSSISIYEYFNYKKLTICPNTAFLIPSNILMTIFMPLIFLDGTMIRIGQYFTVYLMVSLPLIFDHLNYRKVVYFVCFAFLAFQILTSKFEYYFFWETIPGFIY